MSPRRPESKILTLEELLHRYGPGVRTGPVVFTNGCFDLLHPGHVQYLAEARGLGDVLVVGLNTDASVRRLEKGADRPIVPEGARALVLAALESVDAVTLFDSDTPGPLIEVFLPDILVKGGDYEIDRVVGRGAVEGAGGKVVLIPFVEGFSTSALVRRIREGGAGEVVA